MRGYPYHTLNRFAINRWMSHPNQDRIHEEHLLLIAAATGRYESLAVVARRAVAPTDKDELIKHVEYLFDQDVFDIEMKGSDIKRVRLSAQAAISQRQLRRAMSFGTDPCDMELLGLLLERIYERGGCPHCDNAPIRHALMTTIQTLIKRTLKEPSRDKCYCELLPVGHYKRIVFTDRDDFPFWVQESGDISLRELTTERGKAKAARNQEADFRLAVCS